MLLQIPDHETAPIHVAHLYDYVSAYENNDANVSVLVDKLEYALVQSKRTQELVVVDMDGDMSFLVTPAGYIQLMIPWKTFKVVES